MKKKKQVVVRGCAVHHGQKLLERESKARPAPACAVVLFFFCRQPSWLVDASRLDPLFSFRAGPSPAFLGFREDPQPGLAQVAPFPNPSIVILTLDPRLDSPPLSLLCIPPDTYVQTTWIDADDDDDVHCHAIRRAARQANRRVPDAFGA